MQLLLGIMLELHWRTRRFSNRNIQKDPESFSETDLKLETVSSIVFHPRVERNLNYIYFMLQWLLFKPQSVECGLGKQEICITENYTDSQVVHLLIQVQRGENN